MPNVVLFRFTTQLAPFCGRRSCTAVQWIFIYALNLLFAMKSGFQRVTAPVVQSMGLLLAEKHAQLSLHLDRGAVRFQGQARSVHNQRYDLI